MIVLVIAALAVGLVAGAGADALLRGCDPRSVAVVIAGAVGAAAGLFVRRAVGPDGAPSRFARTAFSTISCDSANSEWRNRR